MKTILSQLMFRYGGLPFYISEVYDSATDPETFLANRERGHQFYVRESNATGQGFAVVAGLALLSVASPGSQSSK